MALDVGLELLAFESLSLLKLKQPYFVLVVSNG